MIRETKRYENVLQPHMVCTYINIYKYIYNYIQTEIEARIYSFNMKIRLELTQGIIKTHDDVYTCIYNTEMRQHFFDMYYD